MVNAPFHSQRVGLNGGPDCYCIASVGALHHTQRLEMRPADVPMFEGKHKHALSSVQ
jgi:hypothetical protein